MEGGQGELATQGGKGGSVEWGEARVWDSFSSHQQTCSYPNILHQEQASLGFWVPALGSFPRSDPLSKQ